MNKNLQEGLVLLVGNDSDIVAHMTRGKFIVFEGGEGSGKTHHVRFSQEYLENQDMGIITTHEPGGTQLGRTIRETILSTTHTPVPTAELFLFLADRAQHVETVIQPALQDNTTVLCDRFTGSTLAYQIGARGLANPEFIMQMEAYSRKQLEPDLVIYLDVDPKVGVGRKQIQPGHEMTNFDDFDLDFHTSVRNYFQKLASEQECWVQLDANRTMPEVQQDINSLLDTLFHGTSH